jgi:hypothetical protein
MGQVDFQANMLILLAIQLHIPMRYEPEGGWAGNTSCNTTTYPDKYPMRLERTIGNVFEIRMFRSLDPRKGQPKRSELANTNVIVTLYLVE